MNSGYVLIDFGGLELTSESKVTKTGISDQVKNALATGKPIIAGGLKLNQKAVSSINVLACVDATTATSFDVITLPLCPCLALAWKSLPAAPVESRGCLASLGSCSHTTTYPIIHLFSQSSL